MKKVTIELKRQRRIIRRLKNAPLFCCRGFGRSLIVVGQDAVSPQVDESIYRSIEEFDGRNTPDVEFDHLYDGRDILKYKNQTKKNLHELGMAWRKRINEEFPETDAKIVLHNHEDIWFLDVFNYPVLIEGATYI